jgi:hypothetical protein
VSAEQDAAQPSRTRDFAAEVEAFRARGDIDGLADLAQQLASRVARRQRADKRRSQGHRDRKRQPIVVAIIARDGERCGICGRVLRNAFRAHIDHIRPKFRGGGDEVENLQLAHGKCNAGKKDGDPGGRLWRHSSMPPVLGGIPGRVTLDYEFSAQLPSGSKAPSLVYEFSARDTVEQSAVSAGGVR